MIMSSHEFSVFERVGSVFTGVWVEKDRAVSVYTCVDIVYANL